MVIFTKYSNERRKDLRIRTEILQNPEGERSIRKTAADPAARAHVRGIYEKFLLLREDLKDTGLRVNECIPHEEGVCFPFLKGETLEEHLDVLLLKNDLSGLREQIEQYFACFGEGRELFHMTPEFTEVFGEFSPAQPAYTRSVSDIDMIFSNAILRDGGFELIDYEWTFTFPVPVKFIQYRCLHYYIQGNIKRSVLNETDLFGYFGISGEEQAQFALMEEHFQRYMLGAYMPAWQLYDAISEGVIELEPVIKKESRKRKQSTVELYFDDGRGFGAWNCEKRCAPDGGAVSLVIQVAEGVKAVRFDPCGEKCIVRMQKLRQEGTDLEWTSNGFEAGGGDIIFDTEDPQVMFHPRSPGIVQASFLVEPMDGLARELLLKQYGRIHWMEQTKIWRLYRKLKGG